MKTFFFFSCFPLSLSLSLSLFTSLSLHFSFSSRQKKAKQDTERRESDVLVVAPASRAVALGAESPLQQQLQQRRRLCSLLVAASTASFRSPVAIVPSVLRLFFRSPPSGRKATHSNRLRAPAALRSTADDGAAVGVGAGTIVNWREFGSFAAAAAVFFFFFRSSTATTTTGTTTATSRRRCSFFLPITSDGKGHRSHNIESQ